MASSHPAEFSILRTPNNMTPEEEVVLRRAAQILAAKGVGSESLTAILCENKDEASRPELEPVLASRTARPASTPSLGSTRSTSRSSLSEGRSLKHCRAPWSFPLDATPHAATPTDYPRYVDLNFNDLDFPGYPETPPLAGDICDPHSGVLRHDWHLRLQLPPTPPTSTPLSGTQIVPITSNLQRKRKRLGQISPGTQQIPRQKFKNKKLQEETAMTRKYTACIRCHMQHERVSHIGAIVGM